MRKRLDNLNKLVPKVAELISSRIAVRIHTWPQDMLLWHHVASTLNLVTLAGKGIGMGRGIHPQILQ